MNRPLTASSLLLLICAVASPSPAAEWLSGNELEESCDRFLQDPGNRKGSLCLAFMQGFLSASGTETNMAAAAPAEDSKSNSESYSERAARTRLGTLRMMQLRDTGKPDYCLDDSTPAVEVVEAIASYFRDHPETLQLTNAEAVREALTHNYSCER